MVKVLGGEIMGGEIMGGEINVPSIVVVEFSGISCCSSTDIRSHQAPSDPGQDGGFI